MHERVSAVSRRQPDAVAIRFANRSWSYAEMERLADGVAAMLLERGISPREVVAVHSNRTPALVWSILGILKAGAAFAILDATYPDSRLASRISTARPSGFIRLTGTAAVSETILRALSACDCRFCLEIGDDVPPHKPAFSHAPAPTDLAYVLFTSGTTGTPKGIAIGHQPLPHFLDWYASEFSVNESDRVSMLSGLCHDPLLRDIFVPLTLGAVLCIPDASITREPERLAEWLQEEQITVSHMTPSLLRSMIRASCSDITQIPIFPSLQYAFFGGERLFESDATALETLAPAVTVVNFYGSSETPQAMGYHIVLRSGSSDKTIPLGRGIEGVQLLVLDEAFRLVPAGETGEIYIRTPYLALGYVGDVKGTAERFVPSPFAQPDVSRLYRTGDLGSYDDDGLIHFRGRRDDQVKIRGFRIELEEISSVLLRHPQVGECLVLATGAEGRQKLVAYVVARGAPPSVKELREFLREQLPDFMMPSSILILDAMPLSANGKVDRRRLLDSGSFSLSETKSELGTAGSIAQIFSRILMHRAGIDDDFFELGGDSVSALDVIIEIERVLGRRIPTASIYTATTASQLAALLDRRAPHGSSSIVPLQPSGHRPPLYFLPGGGGITIIACRNLARLLGDDQPVFGLECGLSGEQIPESIPELAATYATAILDHDPQGPYCLLGYSDGSWTAYAIAQQLVSRGCRVAFLGLLDPYLGDPMTGRQVAIVRARHYLKQLTRRSPVETTSKLWKAFRKVMRRDRQRIANESRTKRRRVAKAPAQTPGKSSGMLQVEQAIRDLMKKYKRTAKLAPFPGKLTLFLAEEEDNFFLKPEPNIERNWRRLAGGEFEVHTTPGNHRDVLDLPYVERFSQILRDCLIRAQKPE